MKAPPLYQVACKDEAKGIHLSGYSDMVVFGQNQELVAIRIGGYPETVQAVMAALLSGCTLEMKLSENETLFLQCKGGRNAVRSVSHDGTYAEGVFFLADDPVHSIEVEEQEETQPIAPARNLYLYSEKEDRLFWELDQKLSVPLLPEFSKYLIHCLVQKGILEPLTVRSIHRSFCAWRLTVSHDKKELVEILEQGLQTGAIRIPKAGNDHAFEKISTFSAYLKRFGKQVAGRIERSFSPLYHPGQEPVCPFLKEANRHVIGHAGYSLFDAQLAAAEGLKRQLDRDRLALLVAECGTGKSKIGSAAVYAYWKDRGKSKSLHVVLCPSHLTQKWAREIRETVPHSIAAIVSDLSDVDRLFDAYQQKEKHVFLILSKEDARNGPMRYPAVRWSEAKKGYPCPHCGCIQEMPLVEDTSYTVPADSLFFRMENCKNHTCQACGMPLWSALNPDIQQKLEWVHIGGYGFVSRRFASRNFKSCKDKSISREIERIVENPSAVYPSKGAYRRFPLSAYIKRRLGRIDTLICDELHQYSGESAQGQSMAELAGIADKVVGMTATLINGYSKGIFYLLFRLKPALMLDDRQRFDKPTDFCRQYGVVEKVFHLDLDFNVASKVRKSQTQERFLPGVSPLIYSKFLLENCVFLSLSDMGKELPEYEEIPVPFSMRKEVEQEYKRLEKELKAYNQNEYGKNNRILSAYLNLLSAYPDQPYGHTPIYCPGISDPIVVPEDTGCPDDLEPKDEKVLELVEKKVHAGERVIVYTAWTRLDTQRKLQKLLTKKGYRAGILDKRVPARNREAWVDKQVQDGIDVLITNPALVETGLDLNAFTTLIFYNVSYNLYILRQASRRSWRINQTAPRVEVYLLCYRDTMQAKALKLMANKLAAATVIEGNISEEGLAALSESHDLMAEMAMELAHGIKDNVEELSNTFKRMALHHPETQLKSVPRRVTPFQKNIQAQDQAGQMTLFDLIAKAS